MINAPEGIDPAHIVTNGLAASSIIASWMWLPPVMAFVASLLAAVFYCTQIYDWYKGKVKK